MTISTDLAASNSMSSFIPKYWLNWQILVAVCNKLRRQRQNVHTCPPLFSRRQAKMFLSLLPCRLGYRRNWQTKILQILMLDKQCWPVSPVIIMLLHFDIILFVTMFHVVCCNVYKIKVALHDLIHILNILQLLFTAIRITAQP